MRLGVFSIRKRAYESQFRLSGNMNLGRRQSSPSRGQQRCHCGSGQWRGLILWNLWCTQFSGFSLFHHGWVLFLVSPAHVFSISVLSDLFALIWRLSILPPFTKYRWTASSTSSLFGLYAEGFFMVCNLGWQRGTHCDWQQGICQSCLLFIHHTSAPSLDKEPTVRGWRPSSLAGRITSHHSWSCRTSFTSADNWTMINASGIRASHLATFIFGLRIGPFDDFVVGSPYQGALVHRNRLYRVIPASFLIHQSLTSLQARNQR